MPKSSRAKNNQRSATGGASRNIAPSTRAKAKKKRGGGLGSLGVTWLAIGLVVVVVAALVVVKVISGGGGGGGSAAAARPISATMAHELENVPASIFNAAGTGAVGGVAAPARVSGAAPLEAVGADGVKVPEVLYVGAEYCPYCAAERWPLIIALSRFGTWKGLETMTSSTRSDEPYRGTPTFTFAKATYTSKYIVFKSVESYTNVWDSATGFYAPFQKMTKVEKALFAKYDTSAYITGLTTPGAIPFLDYANQYVSAGSTYNPAILADQSRVALAGGLSVAADPVTTSIAAAANYQSAIICSIDGSQPATVCKSSGVKAATASILVAQLKSAPTTTTTAKK